MIPSCFGREKSEFQSRVSCFLKNKVKKFPRPKRTFVYFFHCAIVFWQFNKIQCLTHTVGTLYAHCFNIISFILNFYFGLNYSTYGDSSRSLDTDVFQGHKCFIIFTYLISLHRAQYLIKQKFMYHSITFITLLIIFILFTELISVKICDCQCLKFKHISSTHFI